jgi:hypothetical protein
MSDMTDGQTQPTNLPHVPVILTSVRILRDEEMTQHQLERASVIATGTLKGQLEAHKILYPEAYMAEPVPYNQRRSVWQKHLLQTGLIALTLSLIGSGGLFIALNFYRPNAVAIALVLILVVLGASFLLAHLIDWQWRETRVVCTADGIGVYRPAHRFLGINKLDVSVPISSIIERKAKKPYLAEVFELNCWSLTFDTAAQSDEFLRRQFRFVVDGDVLLATLIAFQAYNSRRVG